MFKFELGQPVREVITGYTGIIMGRSQFLTGCNQYGVQNKELKDGKPLDWIWFDEHRLKATGKIIQLPGDVKKEPGFDGNHPHKN